MTMDGVQASGAASGGFLEEKLDLTSETDAKLAQARQLASSGNLPEALALLSALEKRCRVGNDSTNLVRTCEASLHLCRDAGDDDALLTTLTSLATRRSQKVAAISALVKTCLPWCVTEPYTPLGTTNVTLRDALVRELRDISDGKLFLERERAVTTRVLATILETAGDIAGAADLLQQVHVETYGSLSKQEKVEYILEQFRLTLAKQDYVRAAIVASKINKKYLTEENMQDYKVKFYTLFAIYHAHEKDAFSLAKDYFAIYSTPNISNDDALWIPALQATILFLALSPYGNEQRDMLHRLSLDANLEKVPACQSTLKLLLKDEIINYPIANQAELESYASFAQGNLAQHWRETLHRRIIQHNIRIASMYYQRIHGARLAQLLQLEPDRLEVEIASMVSEGAVYAKIDRPNDIVRFSQPKNPEAVLTEWSSDIDKLLHLVETTTHMINKENMTTMSSA